MRERPFAAPLKETFRLTWHLAALATTLVVVERLVLLYAATRAATFGPIWVVAGGIISLLFLARVAVRAVTRIRVEAILYEKAIAASLRDDGLHIEKQALEATLFSGIEDSAAALPIVPDLVGEALSLLGVIAYVTRIAPVEVSLGVLLATATLFVIVGRIRSLAMKASARYWSQYQAVISGLQDVIHGRLDLIASASVHRHRARVRAAVAALHRAGRSRWILDTLIGRATTFTVVAVVFVVTMVYGAPRLGLVQMFVLGAALPPLAGVSSAVARLSQARGAFEAVGRLIAGVGVPAERAAQHEAIPDPRATIACDDLVIRLDDRDVLAGITTRFPTGAITAIVGENGAGKSTLLKAIIGLPLPSGGALRLGSCRVEDVDTNAWRRRVAYLPQSPYLPPASVRAAMLMVADADDAMMRSALERIDLWDVLARKRAGDPLAVRVEELSMGERQRIAIARVFVRGAELYLLDEPDTGLDRAGLERLMDVLSEISKEATVIVAAHTPEIVALADHVIELQRGRIVREERRNSAVSEVSRVGSRA